MGNERARKKKKGNEGKKKRSAFMYPRAAASRHARGNKIRFPLLSSLVAVSSHLEAARLLIFIWNVTSSRGKQPRYLQKEAAFGGNDSVFPPRFSLPSAPNPPHGSRFSTTKRSRNAGGQCSRKADSGTAVWPGRCIDRLLRCTFLPQPLPTSSSSFFLFFCFAQPYLPPICFATFLALPPPPVILCFFAIPSLSHSFPYILPLDTTPSSSPFARTLRSIAGKGKTWGGWGCARIPDLTMLYRRRCWRNKG